MTTSKMNSLSRLVSGAVLALCAAGVQAGPADDARAHFKAIAAGDVAAVMQSYAPEAQFQWVGGPLDGAYSTQQAIKDVWSKFTGSQGALKLTVGALEESANPRGATVSANVLFEGKAPIKVRYILTYREGKIVNEVWQIDPNLTVTPAR